MKKETNKPTVKTVNKKSTQEEISDFLDMAMAKEPAEKKQKPKLANIKIEKLKPFEGHPYKIVDDESMEELKSSIAEKGLLNRIIVRPIENTDEYEIISGHRRVHAAELLGIKEVPAVVYFIDRDEATVLMVDSNCQREHILPSERAFAYKLKMEALKSQGKRTDLTSSQIATKLDSANELGKDSGTSRDTVYRYIRLTNLIPELLDMMDEGKIAFSVGVELSFLDDERQYDVLNACEENDNTPSYAQAVEMRKLYKNGELDCDDVSEIMSREKANQRITVKIPQERLYGKIPSGYSAKQTEDFIVKAVEYYHHYLQRQMDAR